MSKSMAIEGIMKIFLMVAVIIVGMSFLLKAFGIDISGWLGEKFAGLGIPDSGKALHIIMDPHDKELFEFHLTRDEKHTSKEFGGGRFSFTFYSPVVGGECLIYLADEENVDVWGRGKEQDEGYTYYVREGLVIDNKQCKADLYECISSNIGSYHGCEQGATRDNQCNSCNFGSGLGESIGSNPNINGISECKQKGSYLNCEKELLFLGSICETDDINDKNERVERFPFDTEIKLKGDCEKAGSNCNLLDFSTKTSDGHIVYKIKYGLLCADGKWQVCKDKEGLINEEKTFGTIKATCSQEGDFFEWSVKKRPTYPLNQNGGIPAWLQTEPQFSETGCVCQNGGTCFSFIGEPNIPDPKINENAGTSKWVKLLDSGTAGQSFYINNEVLYLFTYVHSFVDQQIKLDVKANDGIRIWVNSVDLGDYNYRCSLEQPFSTTLQKGDNKILVRLGNDATGNAFLHLKLKDMNDNPLQNVVVHLNEPIPE